MTQVLPGPQPYTSLFSQMQVALAFNHDTLRLVGEGFAAYGDVFRYQAGARTQVLVRHPDHIHQVLVGEGGAYQKDAFYTDTQRGMARFLGEGLLTANGDFWRRQRRLIQPAFHHKTIEHYAHIMVERTAALLEGWRDGMRFDMDTAMLHLTLDIVASAVFASDVRAHAALISEAMLALQHTTEIVPVIPAWLPLPSRVRARRLLHELDAIVYRLIAQRRAEGGEGSDLLSMLLALRDEDGTGMSDRQLRDETVTLLMAGHETTANTMNWTWLLLSQHPHIEAKLHAELDRVLGGRLPALADLANLPYTDWVIKESMRLYPPAYAVSRMASADTEIGGYHVPQGAIINVFSYYTHRDPRWWEQPEVFMPERFDESVQTKMPRYAYLPFGGGARVCIGNGFAMMEARLVLATMAQRFRVRVERAHVEPEALITLRPKGGLPVRLEARTARAEAAPLRAEGELQPA